MECLFFDGLKERRICLSLRERLRSSVHRSEVAVSDHQAMSSLRRLLTLSDVRRVSHGAQHPLRNTRLRLSVTLFSDARASKCHRMRGTELQRMASRAFGVKSLALDAGEDPFVASACCLRHQTHDMNAVGVSVVIVPGHWPNRLDLGVILWYMWFGARFRHGMRQTTSDSRLRRRTGICQR